MKYSHARKPADLGDAAALTLPSAGGRGQAATMTWRARRIGAANGVDYNRKGSISETGGTTNATTRHPWRQSMDLGLAVGPFAGFWGRRGLGRRPLSGGGGVAGAICGRHRAVGAVVRQQRHGLSGRPNPGGRNTAGAGQDLHARAATGDRSTEIAERFAAKHHQLGQALVGAAPGPRHKAIPDGPAAGPLGPRGPGLRIDARRDSGESRLCSRSGRCWGTRSSATNGGPRTS